MSEGKATSFDAVVPTGWLTAYGRSFSDIPYARELFDELEHVKIATHSAVTLDGIKDSKLAAKFEARYKLIDRIAQGLGSTQILELASGLSTRGMAMAENPAVQYVEVDLPLMMSDKRKICTRLQQRGIIPIRPNLYLENGNAINFSDVERATRHFTTSKPVIVITEGLLRYLTFAEQQAHAKIVAKVLKKFGGTWITPDISLVHTTHGEAGVTAARRKKIAQLTGKNVSENRFLNMKHAVKFFEDMGFKVQRHNFLEVAGQLVSPGKLGLTPEYVTQTLSGAVAFEMQLRTH